MRDTEPSTRMEPPPALQDIPLTPVEPGYRHALRVGWALTVIPVVIGAVAVDRLIISNETGFGGFLTVASVLLAVMLVVVTPQRQYRNWGYTLGSDALRVARGYLFHTDTIVPFVRVQHIDVGQGPVERMFGVSHLVVHTAGTDNSIVTLPGLTPAVASAMRDTIRSQIISDFA